MLRRLILTLPLLALTACAPAPATSSTPEAGSEMPLSLVEPYLAIHGALSTDSVEGVRANAGRIATAATALGAPAMKIDTAAVALAAASGDLAEARSKFMTLSEAMVAYRSGLNLTMPEGVRVAVCPMIQKPWMQRGDDIANPYYGSSMLTCGDFK